MSDRPSSGVKDAVTAVLQSLPDDVSWDEVQYRLYVRQQIDTGLADSDAGHLIDAAELRRRLKERKRRS